MKQQKEKPTAKTILEIIKVIMDIILTIAKFML